LNTSLLSEYLLSHLPSWFAPTQVRVLIVRNGQLTPNNGSIVT
jgi:hypothetical protein